ncbi:MAG: response regulator transcription factor [Trueperaceae bacterium]|nr:response regulator transcription factor [Trueperaceae bacterium]
MRLLLVEDEDNLAAVLRDGLRAHGFEPSWAASMDEAWQLAWEAPFDLFVLDVMLPEGPEAGFEFARQIRDSGFRQPILFLTARDAVPDRVAGLEIGDDYLPKPFAFPELVARLKALYRRGEVRPEVVAWRDVTLVPEERQVRRSGVPVKLTKKEYEVLALLMQNPGRVFTRPDLLDRIWGLGFDVNSNLLDVYVSNLRGKLGEEIVETVRGVGYRFPG